MTTAEQLGAPRHPTSAPQYQECPMWAYHWGPFPATTAGKDDSGICLRYIWPSSVMVARNVVRGVAWADGPTKSQEPSCAWR